MMKDVIFDRIGVKEDEKEVDCIISIRKN